MRSWSLVLVGFTVACGTPAPGGRLADRDQLRREIAGYHSLEEVITSGVHEDERRTVVSISDSLFRNLLVAALPVAVELPGRTTVTVHRATVTFRGNVARVDLTGDVRRRAFPAMAAHLALRGALDSLKVDSLHGLRARLTIDDVTLDTPNGVPGTLSFLTPIVRRALPELTAALPAVDIPVQLDAMLRLPGFGPEGAIEVRAVQAPVGVTASRVIAFQDRLWVFLLVERGGFTRAPAEAK